MKKRYFLLPLSFSILGFLPLASQKTWGMEESKTDLGLNNSFSRSSLSEFPSIDMIERDVTQDPTKNNQHLKSRRKSAASSCTSSTQPDLQNKPLPLSSKNGEDTLSSIDSSMSPRKERKGNITKKERQRSKRNSTTSQKTTSIEYVSSSMDCCSVSPRKSPVSLTPNASNEDILQLPKNNTKNKQIIDDRLERLLSNDLSMRTQETIDLSHISIKDYVGALAQILTNSTALTELNLGHCGLLNPDASDILQALHMNKTLKTLDLSFNVLGGSDIGKYVYKTLRTIKTLTALNLCGNQIDALSMLGIAQTLGTLDQLFSPLSPNRSSMLNQTQSLIYLNLSHNKIGEKGVEHIYNNLVNNMTLTTLDLQRTNIGAEGSRNLALLLASNKGLREINLRDNQIAEGITYITKPLIKNKTIKILDLRDNNMSSSSVNNIVKLLTKNTTLTSIDLRKNQYNARDAMNIIGTLSKNNTLTILNLGFCNFTKKDAQDILKILSKNNTLKALHLGKTTQNDIFQSIHDSLAQKQFQRKISDKET